MKGKFRVILLYVCIVMFSISMAYIVYYKYTMYSENKDYAELKTSKDEVSTLESEDNNKTEI